MLTIYDKLNLWVDVKKECVIFRLTSHVFYLVFIMTQIFG